MKIIVAYDQNMGIGLKGVLPWHIPEDLRHFKRVTKDSVCIVGRKTYESMGKLPGRTLLVVSKDNTLQDCLKFAPSFGKPIFIIGGGSIYSQTIHLVDEVIASEIKGQYVTDTFFPTLHNWRRTLIKEYEHFTVVSIKRDQ